jgi:hypothetical protein
MQKCIYYTLLFNYLQTNSNVPPREIRKSKINIQKLSLIRIASSVIKS